MASKTFSFFALAIIAVFIHSGHADLQYTDCGSKTGTLEKVDMIPPCVTEVCTLPSGQNVTIKLTFKSNEVAKSVTAVVHGLIGGLPFPFPLPNPNACQDSGLTCPLQASTEYQYHEELPILSSYPKLAVTIKYELVDENKEDIVCVEIPSQIK
uniref:MD-2-related lipid-recognition domain-containing protein n=1 Tax=Strigamia maritima TaxID=126957 RepID=T1JGD2_STRMM